MSALLAREFWTNSSKFSKQEESFSNKRMQPIEAEAQNQKMTDTTTLAMSIMSVVAQCWCEQKCGISLVDSILNTPLRTTTMLIYAFVPERAAG